MKKVIAIATADWHFHKFNAFDINGSRLYWALKAARQIVSIAKSFDVPILFAGDLIHSPKNIETETNTLVQKLFHDIRYQTFIAISGNHDLSQRNGINSISPSHLDALGHYAKFYKQDYLIRPSPIPGGWVWGIPYMNSDADLKLYAEKLSGEPRKFKGIKILLIHSDMPGAKTSENYLINEVENIPKNLDTFFKDWDLVLCGHIHRPQKLSNKVYMLGCPIQQVECSNPHPYGYWEVYSDASVKFIELDNYPRFTRLKKGEKIPDNPGINYYIEFNEVLVEEEIEMGEFHINNSKSKLARRYLAQKQIKSKSKRKALIKILNEE